ncbi:MAG: glycerophosphodiester phosphodiesterase family protein [Flavobacteriales bacterium]
MAAPRSYLCAALVSCSFACTMPAETRLPDVHGHRGCRGLMPENTIPAFLRATELGCDFLELDVVVNAEGEVVVSHEPWMDHRICTGRQGHAIAAAHERELNIYRMSTEEVRQCDCGSLTHPDFPAQQNRPAHKPLLSEVVAAVSEHARKTGSPMPRFNVEIKSEPELYDTHQPRPLAYGVTVLRELNRLAIDRSCIVQSFDPAVLEAVHAMDPGVTIALLVDNTDGASTNLGRLSFTPNIYSPHFKLMDAALLDDLHAKQIATAVWTVNDEADMERMIALGVGGIITDYPDRLIALLEKKR